jgi:uncharacterized membrane protein YkvA (DUF1232 family)
VSNANDTRKNKLDRIDEDYVESGAKRVDQEDIQEVVERADEIRDKFERKGPLGRFVEDGKLFVAMTRDYWHGNYREVPYWAIAAVVFTLGYVVTPIDLIPDFIPVVGYVDDAAVMSVCLLMVEEQIFKYKRWKMTEKEREGQESTVESRES